MQSWGEKTIIQKIMVALKILKSSLYKLTRNKTARSDWVVIEKLFSRRQGQKK